jgi:hypothetical protein
MLPILKGNRTSADEKGIELIEFIGLLPIILMVGLIIWQFMVFANTWLIVSNAAREGARKAATYEYFTSLGKEDVKKAVRDTCGGLDCEVDLSPDGLLPGILKRCSPYVCRGEGGCVFVTVKAKLPLVGIPYVGRIGEIWVRSTAIMYCEEDDLPSW